MPELSVVEVAQHRPIGGRRPGESVVRIPPCTGLTRMALATLCRADIDGGSGIFGQSAAQPRDEGEAQE
jgi:hypothetical protein